MVSVIKASASVRRPFHYNENKVAQGDATLLSVQNYPRVTTEISSDMRLKFLLQMTELNTRTKVNAVHISLNFSPDEKISSEKLVQISKGYMKGIGFGGQPYLVYQHHDAGHPHLHIVTTNIELDGRRIPLHNIGRSKSEPTRKAIEKQFGLVRAEDQKPSVYLAKRVDLSRLEYGKSETKRAIGNVLQHVLKNYHFTALPEMNAVLKGYNIVADRGGEESRIFQNRGLVYRVLDEKGEKVGVPIKASSFHFKATLSAVESKFEGNKIARKQHQSALKVAIDMTLLKSPKMNMNGFVSSLERQGIVLVKRENEEGRLYGLTYVDHRSKCVFNGSSLGKEYSAKGISDRLEGESNRKRQSQIAGRSYLSKKNVPEKKELDHLLDLIDKKGVFLRIVEPLDIIMDPIKVYNQVPYEWKRKKKRKKKRHV